MQELSEQERERLGKEQGELADLFATMSRHQQELMRELIAEIRQIERTFAARLIAPAIAALKARFESAAVSAYLDEVAEHMLDHLERFREAAEAVPDAARRVLRRRSAPTAPTRAGSSSTRSTWWSITPGAAARR